jgi:hypothetical protein
LDWPSKSKLPCFGVSTFSTDKPATDHAGKSEIRVFENGAGKIRAAEIGAASACVREIAVRHVGFRRKRIADPSLGYRRADEICRLSRYEVAVCIAIRGWYRKIRFFMPYVHKIDFFLT